MQIVSINFNADHSLLRVTAEGPFALEEAQTQFMDVLQEVLARQAKKVLLDGRLVTGEPLLIQRFFYGEFAAHAVSQLGDRGLLRLPQFAYVLIEPVLDPGRFGQIVAANRGMNIKVFDNMSEAEDWLGISS